MNRIHDDSWLIQRITSKDHVSWIDRLFNGEHVETPQHTWDEEAGLDLKQILDFFEVPHHVQYVDQLAILSTEDDDSEAYEGEFWDWLWNKTQNAPTALSQDHPWFHLQGIPDWPFPFLTGLGDFESAFPIFIFRRGDVYQYEEARDQFLREFGS